MADITGQAFRALTEEQKKVERDKVAAQTPKLPSGPANQNVTAPRAQGAVSPDKIVTQKPPRATIFDQKQRGILRSVEQAKPTDPMEATSLADAADIVNSEAETVASTVPTRNGETPAATETIAETPTEVTPEDDIRNIQEASNARVAQIKSEPSLLSVQQQEISAVQAQAKSEIDAINYEQALIAKEKAKLGADYTYGKLVDKVNAVTDIAEKQGVDLNVAEGIYNKQVTERSKLDPVSQESYDRIISRFDDPEFNKEDAYRTAIAEYEQDGVDSDDMQKAKDAVASRYGQNFADEMEDNFLINDRGVDSAIIEDDRKLINARKLGETVASGNGGARETNAYLKTLFDLGVENVPGGIMKIINSPTATDDAKAQAMAFGKDFYSDVETGIGATASDDYLTEAKFKAGEGTPAERAAFISGTREYQALTASPDDTYLTAARFKAGQGTPEERKQYLENTKILADATTESGGINLDLNKFKRTLSQDFEDASSEFISVQNAFQRVEVSSEAKTAAGDLSMIFNYMKMLDPNSVVRESEFKSAEGAKAWFQKNEGLIGMLPTSVATALQKADPDQKGAFLLPEQRQDFASVAKDLFNEQLINQERRQQQLGEQAEELTGESSVLRDLIDPRFARGEVVTDTTTDAVLLDLTPEDIELFDTLTTEELGELSDEQLDKIIAYKETNQSAATSDIKPFEESAKVEPSTPETASTSAVEFIAKEEGFREEAYKDSAGVWTVGYGTTKINGKPVKEGDTISEENAKTEIDSEISRLESEVDKTFGNSINEYQKVALTSFMYNLGMNILDKPEARVLKKAIKDGDVDTIREQWVQYINAGGKQSKGLQARRERELSQFLTQIV